MAAGTILLFRAAIGRDGIDQARTVAFLSMSFFQLWNLHGMRSSTQSVFTLGPFSNRWIWATIALSVGLMAMVIYAPAFRPIFRLQPLGVKYWIVAIVISSSVLWLVEGWKVLVRRGVIPAHWR